MKQKIKPTIVYGDVQEADGILPNPEEQKIMKDWLLRPFSQAELDLLEKSSREEIKDLLMEEPCNPEEPKPTLD